MTSRCTDCKADFNDLRLDERHGHYTCTLCGVVQSRMLVADSPSTSSIASESRGSAAQRRHIRLWSRQVDTLVDGPNKRMERRVSNMRQVAHLLGLPTSVANDAFAILRKNADLLGDMSPRMRVDCVCVLIASRRRRIHVDVQYLESVTGVTRLDHATKTICHDLRINSRTQVLDALPRVMSQLNFEHKWTERVRRLFKILSAKHPSMGPATRMVLCVYRAHLDRVELTRDAAAKERLEKVTLDLIAYLVGASVCSVRLFVNGRKKCLLFADSYQVCEPRRV